MYHSGVIYKQYNNSRNNNFNRHFKENGDFFICKFKGIGLIKKGRVDIVRTEEKSVIGDSERLA